MRNACMNSLINLGKNDERIILISIDQPTSFEKEFKEALNKRFIFEPISEANVVSMSSGLASNGYIPYIFGHAAFNTRRCYEQIALDACLQKNHIRLIGMGGGLVNAHLGPTHTAIEDISLLRSIPGMTVLVPCDAQEIKELMPQTVELKQSIYIRLAQFGEPKYGKKIERNGNIRAKIGKANVVYVNNKNSKTDVLFISNGVMTPISIESSMILSNSNINSKVLNVTTAKPIDTETVCNEVSSSKHVVIVEEHTLIGGLASACLENLTDNLGSNNLPPIHRIGLPDKFILNYGNQKSLLQKNDMMPEQIAKRVICIVNKVNK